MRALWFCVALMPVLAQADIYRWTDAQGKVHFSATPPAGAQRVEVRPQVMPLWVFNDISSAISCPAT